MTDEELFEGAQRLSNSQQRDYLGNHAVDESQIERVESLLRADQKKDSLLDLASTADSPATDGQSIDQIIGNYKLLQKIGEGGMGTVYMAEQLRPVKRVVAFKVIKAGMDSKQVVARFEAERQSLALMDHPNIAKVLDAGWTQSGPNVVDRSVGQNASEIANDSGGDRGRPADERRTALGLPYFVMELVKGVPINKYCDDNRLPTEQRVRLMMDVCNAIQHAHQKGIIHRDLKPSNSKYSPKG
ncbi:MAG: protein kinase [Planctomycetales bacterium]|nr:protein kinase [Planctomycetales bacterium]